MKKRLLVIALAAVFVVSVSALVPAVTAASPAPALTDPQRITINSGKQFVVGNGTQRIWMNGANTPWENWNDFGGNYDASWWDSHFTQLHANGVNSTRVWIDCNNEQNAVTISSNGTVSGVSSKFFSDLDSFFALAQKHQIYIMATLISFDEFKSAQATSWQNMLKSSATIDSFVNNYTIPFVQRYGGNPYLWSIDVCNEPDWIYESSECGNLPWSDISNYIARNAAAIHENSSVLVTVGLAMPKYASDVKEPQFNGNFVSNSYLQSLAKDSNAYLDFYAMHYYDWMQPYWGDPFYMTPTAWGLDGTKPAVISENPALGTKGHTLLSNYQGALKNGWQGALAWTSNGVDGNGGLSDLIKATAPMAKDNPSLIFPLSANPAVTVIRMGGTDRYETAIKVAQQGWKTSNTVLLAYGGNFPDAMAAVPLATALSAPILLTDVNLTPGTVMNEIKSLKAKNIILLGGTGVISAAQQSALTKAGYNVTRFGGSNRYGTAGLIGNALEKLNASKTAVLTTGEGYADALSIGPVAGMNGYPVVFTATNSLPNETTQFLKSNGITSVVIVGGTGAVGTSVEKQLKTLGIKNIARYGGVDRYATSTAIVNQYKSSFSIDVSTATGMDFPDALTGGVLAARLRMPLLLLNPASGATTSQKTYVKGLSGPGVYVFGGAGALSDAIVQSLYK